MVKTLFSFFRRMYQTMFCSLVPLNNVGGGFQAYYLKITEHNDNFTTQLPHEGWLKIFLFLPCSDLASLALVCSTFKTILENSPFWGDIALREELTDPNWGQTPEKITNKLRLKNFLAESKVIETIYPEKLRQALGGAKKMTLLPLLDLQGRVGSTGYLDFVTPPEMKGYKIKRGVDVCRRPFVTICVERGDGPDVETLFQRYAGGGGWRLAGHHFRGTLLPLSPDDLPDDSTYEYLGRLAREEPCGYIVFRADGTKEEKLDRPAKLSDQLASQPELDSIEAPEPKKRRLAR